MQALQRDRRILQRHHEIEFPALVLQEQVLGVAARDLPAQRPGLLDREQGRMGYARVCDPETVEQGEQFGGSGGHLRWAG